MRKLSDIVRRPSIPGILRHESLVIVEYEIAAPGHSAIDVIANLYREIDYPRTIRPDNVAHISGANEERVIFASVWRNDREASSAFAEAEQAIARLTEKFGPEAGVERTSHKAHRVTIGDGAEQYDAALAEINPDCVAFAIDLPCGGRSIYDLYCKEMRFPAEIPDGLLLHLAYEVGKELRTISVWQSIEHSRDFMRDRIIPAGPAVVRDNGVFPEVRPVEFKPTLLAFNLDDDNRVS